MPKRFYSVKETAKILGVSTNTVYKYLDEGSLKGKRFNNKGRFKIPFSELTPYLDGEMAAKASEETPAVKQEDQKARGKLTAFRSLFTPSLIGLFLLLLLWNFGQGATGSQSSLTEDIGNAVLGYSDRTFSGFGSLVSRFLPEAQQFAEGIQPPDEIVSSFSTQIVSEEKAPDLSYKIENTNGRTNELYANVQVLASSTQRLLSKSRTLTSAELNNAIEEMSQLLGSLPDSSDQETIFAEINWLNENWDFSSIKALKRAASNASDLLVSLQRQSQAVFTRPDITDLNNLVIEANHLLEFVGDPSDLPSEKTLYGNVKGVETLAKVIDAKIGEIDKVLGSWDNSDISEKENTIKSILSDTLSINVLPKVDEVVFSGLRGPKDESELKNSLLSVKGVLTANKIHFAQKAGETVAATWPEWDGAAYKILIINPSKKDSHEVAYKYYLPSDLKRGDVEQTDKGLVLSFDNQKNQYFMEVNLPLPAGEAKTLSLKTNNIFKIDQPEAKTQKTGGQEIPDALETTTADRQNNVLGTQDNKPLVENVVPETNIARTITELPNPTALGEKIAGLRVQIPRENMAAFGLIIFLSGLIALIVYLMMTFIRGNKKSVQAVSGEVQSAGVESILIPKFSAKKEKIRKGHSWLTLKFRAVVLAILVIPASIMSFFSKVISSIRTFFLKTITAVIKFVVGVTTSLLQAVKATINAVVVFIEKLISALVKAVVSIGSGVLAVLTSLRNFFLNLVSSVAGYIMAVATALKKALLAVIGAIRTFVANVVSAIGAFVAKIILLATNTLISTITFFLKVISSITKTLASVIKEVLGVSVSIIKFTDLTLARLNFGATVRETRRGLRVADIFLLVGLTAALISVSAALATAAQVERSQQAAFKEKEATPNPEPIEEIPVKKVTIKPTETDWLRVRETPSGNEIGKVYPGETFNLLDEASGWYLLELSDGVRGWVFARYASLE